MIAGHKIEQYLTIRWVEAEVNYWEVTTHRTVTELHATKGWRVVRRDRSIQRTRKFPSWRERDKATLTTFVRTRQLKPDSRTPTGLTPVAMERAVMRHKVRRVEIQRAKNLAANA